ncbi:hypothetical protein B5G38_06340 [Gemmiger sp. An87]|nr:hypothetical protein B5G38_06340 [Gemmiger sp. An87]
MGVSLPGQAAAGWPGAASDEGAAQPERVRQAARARANSGLGDFIQGSSFGRCDTRKWQEARAFPRLTGPSRRRARRWGYRPSNPPWRWPRTGALCPERNRWCRPRRSGAARRPAARG